MIPKSMPAATALFANANGLSLPYSAACDTPEPRIIPSACM